MEVRKMNIAKGILSASSAVLLISAVAMSQQAVQPQAGLSVHYEELTALDFVQAVAKSEGTCIIPLGIIEKHGPHLPLGTDLLDCREVALRAARQEYTIIFPAYFVGQIFEAKHQPGTIAYSASMMLDLLQETCDELGRNGITKIILLNGHGGNEYFLRFFCQAQLASRKDYAVYLFDPAEDESREAAIKKLRKTTLDGHAGEMETSTILAHRPDLAHVDRAGLQSGEDQKRLANLKHAYTGIWWYASQPNHYRGNGSFGNKELGEMSLNMEAGLLSEMIRSVKKDTVTLELQKTFFDDAAKPLKTKQ
jgi:creatinine amidohydrolase